MWSMWCPVAVQPTRWPPNGPMAMAVGLQPYQPSQRARTAFLPIDFLCRGGSPKTAPAAPIRSFSSASIGCTTLPDLQHLQSPRWLTPSSKPRALRREAKRGWTSRCWGFPGHLGRLRPQQCPLHACRRWLRQASHTPLMARGWCMGLCSDCRAPPAGCLRSSGGNPRRRLRRRKGPLASAHRAAAPALCRACRPWAASASSTWRWTPPTATWRCWRRCGARAAQRRA